MMQPDTEGAEFGGTRGAATRVPPLCGNAAGEGLATAFARECRRQSRVQSQLQQQHSFVYDSPSKVLISVGSDDDAMDSSFVDQVPQYPHGAESALQLLSAQSSGYPGETTLDGTDPATALDSQPSTIMSPRRRQEVLALMRLEPALTPITEAIEGEAVDRTIEFAPPPRLKGAVRTAGTAVGAVVPRLRAITSCGELGESSSSHSPSVLLANGGMFDDSASPQLSPRTAPLPPSILSPRPLNVKPEFTHPQLHVANMDLRPKDITPRFLIKHGRQPFLWNRVRSVMCTPFQDAVGLSEATMFHCVLEYLPAAESPQSSNDYGAVTSSLGVAGGRLSELSNGETVTPAVAAPSGRLGVVRRIWARAKSLMAVRGNRVGKPASTINAALPLNATYDDPTSAQLQRGPYHPGALHNYEFFGESARHSSLRTTTASSTAHSMGSIPRSGTGLYLMPPLPPQFMVIKHYNTTFVDTPDMTFRLARHLTATTAEKMVTHELFFYSKLSAFFCDASSPFRCPKPMFITSLNRGDPSLVRYVCCGTGSGTIVTLGLEDMQRAGFNFDHGDLDGLFEESTIYAVIVALAFLHSSMWDRCHEPALRELEPAPILLFVHRGASKIQHLLSKNEFVKVPVTAVCDRWASYNPTWYIQSKTSRLMLAYLRFRWGEIRSEALEIIHRRDTILHGDAHYKNIGFRSKHIAGSKTHRAKKASVGNSEAAGATCRSMSPLATPSALAAPQMGMLQRFFSQDNVLVVGSHPGSHSNRQQTTSSVREEALPPPASRLQKGSFDADGNVEIDRLCVPCSQSQNRLAKPPATVSPPGTPIAKQTASYLDLQPCFLDYQSCGPGSIAGELLYFICTSIPVDVDLNHQGPLLDVSMLAVPKAPSSGLCPPTLQSQSNSTPSNNVSFAGLNVPPSSAGGIDDPTIAAACGDGSRSSSSPALHRLRSSSTNSGATVKMSLDELLSFDVMLITTYHQNLDPVVQAAYPLSQLIHDVYVLARHWTGCVFFDLASSDPRQRAGLKALQQYQRLITWGERTAERAMMMSIAVFAEVDGRISDGGEPGQDQREQ